MIDDSKVKLKDILDGLQFMNAAEFDQRKQQFYNYLDSASHMEQSNEADVDHQNSESMSQFQQSNQFELDMDDEAEDHGDEMELPEDDGNRQE